MMGLMRRVFRRTALTLVTIDLHEGSPFCVIDVAKLLLDLLSMFILDVRMFDRIVSNSTSTFL